ncbi:MAG: hypothetical protein ACXWBH_03110 [Candidatus Angelobacter sp.]
MFPRFHIIRSDAGEFFGSVTATTFGNETWVGDGWIGCLMADKKFIFGRWHKGGYVRRDSWAFVPDDPGIVEVLQLDTEWVILAGYWGERAELVLDPDRKWQKALYEESDHDHCAICWETLGPGGQLEGYVSEDATWICCRCYESFVQPWSLDFIPGPKPQ